MDDFTWFLVGIAGGAVTALGVGYAALVWYTKRNEEHR
jgi:hypothetical protein